MKRSLEVDAEAEPVRSVRLKWVAQRKPVQRNFGAISGHVRMVLESFELVQRADPAASAELACEVSTKACVAAANLLANLLQFPPSAIVIAEFPLIREKTLVLQPLSCGFSNV